MAAKTAVRQAGESDALWMLGGFYEIKVSSDETGDAMSVIEFTVPEGSGPPPHVHNCAELVYVIEGTARFHADGETFEAGPGAVLHFPEGTEETFEPIGQVKLLTVYTPGGMDRFFKQAGEPAQRREIPPPSDAPPDLERLVAIAEKHGLELRVPAQT
jgi:quercetin dioxygenase-like cupin family protein